MRRIRGKSTARRSPLKAESVEVKDREGMLKDIYKLDNGVLIFWGKKAFFFRLLIEADHIEKHACGHNFRRGCLQLLPKGRTLSFYLFTIYHKMNMKFRCKTS